jgi:hypothetical protein
MIRDGTRYIEQSADYFDRLHPDKTKRRLMARLENLGYNVSITPGYPPQPTKSLS